MNAPAVSGYLIRLPAEFLRWWFLEAPITLLKILKFIFEAAVHLFSFKLLFTTYLKPWKNEYREGLVRTGIFIGAFIKTWLILFDIAALTALFVVEATIFVAWLLLPFFAIILLYGAIFT
ncbi:MAG: hypothetical protein A2Z42_01900 [Candidatus Woykebacteria bacterium RBG_19FT_COMBO_43_10]|uniref:Uncharacterized protein n=1 Tax=Candidatus Woykebacteria bacterium RBG_19FT_COMBO_43_10 TaxID=1802598 RepID=A0A1G1WG44_9BACT|nr:MAG: hypothetical protein A2Z42_01900 [Candidatus Woykebacteria bacterium RBG_19FT_COMBO_43_10]